MNAAQSSDGDPLTELQRACGYIDGAEDDETGGIDALIAYKDALEDRVRFLEGSEAAKSEAARAAERIAAQVPREDEWDSAADFMEHAAETLDIYGVARPAHYSK